MKTPRQHIAVIGLGQFGAELAINLAREADVLAIDNDETNVNRISDQVQRALVIDARDYLSLKSVVTRKFDLAIVGVGKAIEPSTLCTLHLKKIGVPKIYAKAGTPDHAAILRALGADRIIFPERDTAQHTAAEILHPNLRDYIPLAEGYEIMELPAPPAFIGKTIMDSGIRPNYNALVIGARAVAGSRVEGFTFLPPPDFVIERHHILLLIGLDTNLDKLRALGDE